MAPVKIDAVGRSPTRRRPTANRDCILADVSSVFPLMAAANASPRAQRSAILASPLHELTGFCLEVDCLAEGCLPMCLHSGSQFEALAVKTIRPITAPVDIRNLRWRASLD
jgi:hypothetical protein